ncbi:MAG: IS200/IS605 family transposase [Thaumarchaeota archaeon]|nr:IS200/IS605 family transposase [Nitrososphaerota archaeon]
MKNTASSAVHNINYHLVWCSKYRKKILVGNLKEFLDQEITNIAESKGYEILEMRVMPDHIHLFVQCTPFDSPVKIVKSIQRYFYQLCIQKVFQSLDESCGMASFSSPSYYVGTAGHVSAQIIEKYICEQEK